METPDNCIFCKIVSGQIPARKIYESEDILAFHDIAPWAPIHWLIIPKIHIPSLANVQAEHQEMLGRMMLIIPQLAIKTGAKPYPEGGFRVVINTGNVGKQEVHHLHIHVLSGEHPWKTDKNAL